MVGITSEHIKQAVSRVMHPEIDYSLMELGMIGGIECVPGRTEITLKLPSLQVPIKDLLVESVKQAVEELDRESSVHINVEEMTQEEREKFKQMAKEGWKL
jgi:metal-sulfur cluster biosynthetic enzyme